MLSTVFSVIFSMSNSMLMGFVYSDQVMLKNILVSTIFISQIFTLCWTNFIFTDMSYHSWVALLIAIIFTMILIPSFGYMTD